MRRWLPSAALEAAAAAPVGGLEVAAAALVGAGSPRGCDGGQRRLPTVPAALGAMAAAPVGAGGPRGCGSSRQWQSVHFDGGCLGFG
ncbi:Os06g0610700 [Oryza sativa Japonica Group]|uniref:Secreted protein n=2 Tax=Oryza sativa subsp. japonica TaxID=39947 RepID=A0A8J8YRX9_ORYSJ|nr:hypothetical protein OsJ_21948 [Oryza sativa Japonica Group]BAS98582.1 Os06g0610700 [Oryza sativa Japonica Group]